MEKFEGKGLMKSVERVSKEKAALGIALLTVIAGINVACNENQPMDDPCEGVVSSETYNAEKDRLMKERGMSEEEATAEMVGCSGAALVESAENLPVFAPTPEGGAPFKTQQEAEDWLNSLDLEQYKQGE